MNEWKAKYNSLTGLVEPRHVAAAEQIVKSAICLSASSTQPLGDVLDAIFTTAQRLKNAEQVPGVWDKKEVE